MQLYFSYISLISNLSIHFSRKGENGPFIWRPKHHGRGGGWKAQALTSLPLGICWVSLILGLLGQWLLGGGESLWTGLSPKPFWKPPSSHTFPGVLSPPWVFQRRRATSQAAFTDSGFRGFCCLPRKADSRLLTSRPETSSFPPQLLGNLLSPAPVSSVPWPSLLLHLPNAPKGQQSKTRKAHVFPQRF